MNKEGKFEKDLGNHHYPLTVVIRDLPDKIVESEFANYLAEHKISILPVISRGEAVFKVNSFDDSQQFLELVGGIYKQRKIVLSV